MGSSSKKRQTMAKFAREKAVKERRALKLEKKQRKQAAAQAGEPAVQDEDARQPEGND